MAGLGLGAVTLLMVLSGCSVEGVGKAFGNFGWPDRGISLQAHKMYDLWIASVIAALVVGIFVWGLIFWCIIRYRKRGDELPVQTRFNMPMEVLYTVTPILVVAVLFYYTAIVQTDVDKLSKNPDQVVEVVAFKWQWQFNYRDGVGEEAKTVALTRKVGPTPLHVHIRDAASLQASIIDDLKSLLASYPGECEVLLEVQMRSGDPRTLKLGPSYKVAPTPTLRAELEQVLGPAALAV